jgi:hypothetical protein
VLSAIGLGDGRPNLERVPIGVKRFDGSLAPLPLRPMLYRSGGRCQAGNG